ncbi:MAG: hypothetical protein NC038_01330 [Paludibacter sp.]|nr:hypothetical protein [Bacteroidales bacterium]MCM1068851.1 hypothetical protein [Prevotella sp.]MCM1353112.1 hypothetical protein [Bacteroides sp.]MCM1442434.1 hypothetical protein [Muribaculum sp.]MCM1481277.1 hypothetical protein [Paludibacter sp.]
MKLKSVFCIICAGILLAACSSNKQTIRSKQLQGKYEVDFSELIKHITNETDDFATSLAAWFISSMQMTMQFDENRLIIDAAGATRTLFNLLDNDSITMPISVDYKIKNDSVLYTRFDNGDYKSMGTLRRLGNNYDYLRLTTTDGEPMTLILRKIVE